MKLKELASKLGLKLRGDGEIEILAPVPIEAAAPGTIIFAAGAGQTRLKKLFAVSAHHRDAPAKVAISSLVPPGLERCRDAAGSRAASNVESGTFRGVFPDEADCTARNACYTARFPLTCARSQE